MLRKGLFPIIAIKYLIFQFQIIGLRGWLACYPVSSLLYHIKIRGVSLPISHALKRIHSLSAPRPLIIWKEVQIDLLSSAPLFTSSLACRLARFQYFQS